MDNKEKDGSPIPVTIKNRRRSRRSSLFGTNNARITPSQNSSSDNLPNHPDSLIKKLKTDVDKCNEIIDTLKNKEILAENHYNEKLFTIQDPEHRDYLSSLPDLNEYVAVATKYQNKVRIRNQILVNCQKQLIILQNENF